MYSGHDTHRWVGFPIQISTDQSLLAAPHGFSQRATSFVASWCQGIHRMPLSRSFTTHAQEPSTQGQTVPHIRKCSSSHDHSSLLRRSCTLSPHRTARNTPVPRTIAWVRPTRDTARTRTHQPIHTDKEQTHQTKTPGAASRLPDIRPISFPNQQPSSFQTHSLPASGNPYIMQGHLVEADGIEPTTPCLQSRCSPS